MMIEWLTIFIVISIIFFIIILYTVDDNPVICVPLIIVNLIIITFVMMGFMNVEWFYIDTSGNPGMYSTDSYANPYSYVFFAFFFINAMLFVKAAVNYLRDSLKTKGEMNYSMKYSKNRRY